MKNINFSTYSELVDECLELLEEKDSVTIVADEDLATEILDAIDLFEYEDYDIDFSEDVDTYLIGKVGDKFFCIESAIWTEGEHIGEYKYTESDYMVIFDDIADAEMIDNYEGDIQTILLSYDEYDLDDLDCNGNYEECEFGYNDEEETISDIIDFYVDNIIDNQLCPDCIRTLLETFFDEIVEMLEED